MKILVLLFLSLTVCASANIERKIVYPDVAEFSNNPDEYSSGELRMSSQCISKMDCGSCIKASPLCAWCASFGNFSARCDTVYNLQQRHCPQISLYHPQSSLQVLEDTDLSAKTVSDSEPFQMRPQKISLMLRPKSPQTFQVQFKQAQGYSSISQEVTSAFELKDDARPEIKIDYASTCLGDKSEYTRLCKGLRVGDSVTYDLSIELESCPANRNDWKQSIRVYPIGLKDSLMIDVKLLCECDCEREDNVVFNSPMCNYKGSAQCSSCECQPGFEGERCECDSKDLDMIELQDKCRPGNDTKLCSGRGTCRCGICECYPRESPEKEVTGDYCECDNFSCERHDGKICAGPDNGVCHCGECQCKPGWSGPDCSCKVDNSTCIHPGNGKICGGHGQCHCGQCVCDASEEATYIGQYCEQCPTCKNLCDVYKDCVQCRVHNTGPLNAKQCASCSINPITTTKFQVQEDEELCVAWDRNDCIFHFKYKFENDEKTAYVVANNTKDCPPWTRTPQPVDTLAIVNGSTTTSLSISLIHYFAIFISFVYSYI